MRQIIDFLFSGSDNPRHQQIVKIMWVLFLGGIAAVLLLFIVLSFTDLPSVKQLENPKSNLATEIYGDNGEVLGRLYYENRVPVSYDELDRDLVNALVATEDERYFEHTGIDFPALGRVFVKTILLGQRSSGGASTITQQLAKQLFTGTPGSGLERVIQKLKEWIIAVRLERKYTKEEIIALYLNKVDFLYQSYGIKAAAENYFDKSQDSLNVEEAALLVGMLKNPSLYNPIRFPERAQKRREVVLKQMQKNELIPRTVYDSLRQLTLDIRFSQKTHIDGIATYFRNEVAKDVKAILQQPNYRKPDGSSYDLYEDGLKIYTTINPEMQRIAEREMLKHMKGVQQTFRREWRNKDPWKYMQDPQEDIPISVRKEGLNRLIRGTERYQGLRNKYLQPVLDEISNRVPDLVFHNDDREVMRIVQEYETRGHLEGLIDDGIISESLAKAYRRVLRDQSFPKLKTQWERLQDAVKTSFDRQVQMKVFTYENENFEKDTVMSPLDSLKYHRMFLQTGILAVDPNTGQVKVWVGGINQKYFQYDHVRTSRQVGSTFKPFIYATAIDQQGISPCYQVYDLPQTIKPGDGNFFLLEEWTPRNFDGKYTGELFTLKEGLRKSKNTISVFLMKQLRDVEPVRTLVNNMGIDTSARYPNGRYRLPKVPSICLGATDLTVMEMTGAYTTFANNGIYIEPQYIMRIEDKNGQLIYQSVQNQRRALHPNSNYVMVDMLRYSGALGSRVNAAAGGKTGTTNDFVDGWFMGVTPDLVVGTWVGGEDRWIRFLTPYNGQGSRMAKPFFVNFINALGKSAEVPFDPDTQFYRPQGPLGIELDCSRYQTEDLEIDSTEQDEFSEDVFGDEIQEEDPFGSR